MAVFSRLRLIATTLVCALVAAACAASAPSSSVSTSDLTGTRWVAALIDGVPVALSRAPRLIFGDGDRLSGTGGCNTLSAFYEAANGAIDVRALGRTEMACDTSVMRQEDAFMALLADVVRYQRDGDRLILTAENGRTVTLMPGG